MSQKWQIYDKYCPKWAIFGPNWSKLGQKVPIFRENSPKSEIFKKFLIDH